MKEYKSNIDKISLTKTKGNFKRVKIKSSSNVSEYARNFYHEDIEIYESVFLILLNRQNNTIGYVKISQGGLSSTIMDTRLIVKYALESLATAVVLVHNHPSGQLEPSKADISITKTIRKGLELFDITLLDHVIITTDGFKSLADECLL